jgi:ribosomal protein S21
MNKATKSLENHFKNFKKKTKIERLLSVIEKKETYEQSDQKLGKSF